MTLYSKSLYLTSPKSKYFWFVSNYCVGLLEEMSFLKPSSTLKQTFKYDITCLFKLTNLSIGLKTRWKFCSDFKDFLSIHMYLFLSAFRTFYGGQKLCQLCSKQGTYFHLLSWTLKRAPISPPLRKRCLWMPLRTIKKSPKFIFTLGDFLFNVIFKKNVVYVLMKWETFKKGCVRCARQEIMLDLFWICDNKLKNMVMLLPTSSQPRCLSQSRHCSWQQQHVFE